MEDTALHRIDQLHVCAYNSASELINFYCFIIRYYPRSPKFKVELRPTIKYDIICAPETYDGEISRAEQFAVCHSAVLRRNAIRAFRRCRIFLDKPQISDKICECFSSNFSKDFFCH